MLLCLVFPNRNLFRKESQYQYLDPGFEETNLDPAFSAYPLPSAPKAVAH